MFKQLFVFSKLSSYSHRTFIRKFHQRFPIKNLFRVQESGVASRKRLVTVPVLIGSMITVALCEYTGKDPCLGEEKAEKSSSGGKSGSGTNSSDPCCSSASLNECLNKAKAAGYSCDKKPICWEKQDLTHSFLLKQANVVTIDAITRILTETMSAIEDYHTQYRQLLQMLMDLMEESRCATDTRLELINCKQIVVRSSIDDMKRSLIELESYLDSVCRLAHAAAETAFLASAEYASIALMERLHSCQCQVKDIKEKTMECERASNELYSLIIVESGQGLK